MIVKLCYFFALALALSSLDTANAVSPRLVSGSVDQGPQIRSDIQLNKRDVNARLTFYNVGLGACGTTSVPSDFVVALDASEFGNPASGPHCFQNIIISAAGKTATARIVDMCPGCPFGGLDLSTGLFQFFAPLSEGVISGSWSYVV